MNRRIIDNGFLLATRRAKYLAGSVCGTLILDLFDSILSNKEIPWLQIDYKQIQAELDYDFSYKTIARNIKLLEQKGLIISQTLPNKRKIYTLNYDLINSASV